MTTSREVEDAIVAALAAGNAVPKRPDEFGADENSLPDHYTEVWVSEVPGERDRIGRGIGFRQFRILTRAVGRAHYSNAQTMRDRARDALEDKVLTVGDVQTSPILRDTADDPIQKDGPEWYSGASVWRLFV